MLVSLYFTLTLPTTSQDQQGRQFFNWRPADYIKPLQVLFFFSGSNNNQNNDGEGTARKNIWIDCFYSYSRNIQARSVGYSSIVSSHWPSSAKQLAWADIKLILLEKHLRNNGLTLSDYRWVTWLDVSKSSHILRLFYRNFVSKWIFCFIDILVSVKS